VRVIPSLPAWICPASEELGAGLTTFLFRFTQTALRGVRSPFPLVIGRRFLPGPVLAAIQLSPSDTKAASLCTAIYYEFLLRLGKHRAYLKVVLHSPSLKTRVRGGESGSVILDGPNRSRGSVEFAVDRKRSPRRQRYDNNEEGICPS
jgi:hypothetical protein